MIQNAQKKDILDILLEINDKKGENLEDGDIIDLLITLLFTGHETTAIAVMWSITYLTKNPLCLKKARVNHLLLIIFFNICIEEDMIKYFLKILARFKTSYYIYIYIYI
jgi:cytochrome P450